MIILGALARSTIEGHLARGIGEGKADIAKVMEDHRVGRSGHSWKRVTLQ